VLTIIRENKKTEVINSLRTRVSKEVKDGKEEEIKTTIKNLKMKHIPIDLRPKKTRAMRRRLTKFQSKKLTLKQLKRKLNFPMRKFAVPKQA
jgi:large subunit ribosomal protein L35e